ncbi:MAG TPA: hypothetical protein VFU21_10575 [Kofleriaceae bacterium]|nr:hypothetical protein [Kofleriaceae bacterium]
MRTVPILVLLLGACGGDDDGGGGGDGGERPDAADPGRTDGGGDDGACTPARRHARFTVTASATMGGVYGAWDDRPYPAPDAPEVEEGGCFFVGPASHFCDPPCDGATICTADETCQPLPVTLPAGTVHIGGTDPELDLDPQPGNSYYTTENHPGLYQPGDVITVSSEGAGDVPAFEISARGVPELTVPWESVTATEHQDMTVTWDADDTSPAGTQVVLHMDNDHHGVRAYVECWSDDTGALTVPAAVLDPLILAGESGIGTYIENAWMARRNRGTIDTDSGCAVLDGESQIFIAVETVRAR